MHGAKVDAWIKDTGDGERDDLTVSGVLERVLGNDEAGRLRMLAGTVKGEAEPSGRSWFGWRFWQS
jgi:hypothetical protein